MSDLSKYAGKTILITGAGDGIGAMLARQFSAIGMHVIVQDIRLDAATAIAAELGENAFALQADVSDRESLARSAEALKNRGTQLSFLWLNAGAGVGAPVLEGKPKAIEWAFSVNVLGIIWSMQAYWPFLKDTDGVKHVGFTASSASLRRPEGDFPLYALTKHGTFAVAETLRAELTTHGIASTILCPGLLNTDIWDGARARPERFGGARHMDPAISAQWRAAQDPVIMWPHIVKTIADGGGYLVCPTDATTGTAFTARHKAIQAGFQPLFGADSAKSSGSAS